MRDRLSSLIQKITLFFRQMNGSQAITLIFAVIILIGTVLLLLPVSSRDGQSCGILTALFTATSSTCVTGLALADTYTQWSLFGQIVILALIQIGGLGFMTIASLFFFAVKRKINMEQLLIMAQTTGTDSIEDVTRIYKKILVGALSIELLGATVLALRFMEQYSIAKSIWLGVFHSVSAFCNAGFDILGFEEPGVSLIRYGTDPVICITIMVLIVVGGIGFVVWDDISRIRQPKKWSVYTKIVLVTTIILILFGTVFFYLVERYNDATIGGFSTGEQILASLFQSVTTRTAGFAAIDQGSLTESGKIITIMLMFIGGASGSTAGGLKVVTFAIIMSFLFARMRGRNTVRISHRKVSDEQIMSSLCLAGISIFLSMTGALVICSFADIRFVDGLYEAVSALATVGLSTGITADLSLISKILIIIYMFFGRIGILTINMGFFRDKHKYQDYEYPEASLMVG